MKVFTDEAKFKEHMISVKRCDACKQEFFSCIFDQHLAVCEALLHQTIGLVKLQDSMDDKGRVSDKMLDETLMFDPNEFKTMSRTSQDSSSTNVNPLGEVSETMILKRENYFIKLTGKSTSELEREALFKMPVPPEVGMIQLTIDRDKSGLNKIWPKYYLRISEEQLYGKEFKAQKSQTSGFFMLDAKSQKTNKTMYLRVEMSASHTYIGRLR